MGRPATSASRSGLVARSCPSASVGEHDPAENRWSGRSAWPRRKIEPDASPRLAGSQPGPINPPRLDAGGTSSNPGVTTASTDTGAAACAASASSV